MNLSPQSQFSSKASQLLSWGHWFTFANILLALVISTSYLFAENPPSTPVGWVYMVITWLSHTSFITFCAFVLTIFPLSLVFPYPKHIRGMASVIATFGILVLSVDAFVYFNLGYHINLQSLSEILSLFWKTITDTPVFNTLIVLFYTGIILTFQLLASNYAWKHLDELKSKLFPKVAGTFLVGCFAASHSLHIWADANAEFDITKQDNILPLSYPTTAKSLLAKNDLLDLEQYAQARSIELSGKQVALYQPNLPFCESTEAPTNIYVYDELTQMLSALEDVEVVETNDQLLLPTNRDDALFNLVYGLPSYYSSASDAAPLWSLEGDLISVDGFSNLSFESDKPALINYFLNANKISKDIPFIAINLSSASRQAVANTVYATNVPSLSNAKGLIQGSDIIYTLLSEKYGCSELAINTVLGSDIVNRRIVEGVNYTQGTLVAYKKDKITLVNSDGSYVHISAKEGFSLNGKLDIPFLIHSIKQLQKFSQSPSS